MREKTPLSTFHCNQLQYTRSACFKTDLQDYLGTIEAIVSCTRGVTGSIADNRYYLKVEKESWVPWITGSTVVA